MKSLNIFTVILVFSSFCSPAITMDSNANLEMLIERLEYLETRDRDRELDFTRKMAAQEEKWTSELESLKKEFSCIQRSSAVSNQTRVVQQEDRSLLPESRGIIAGTTKPATCAALKALGFTVDGYYMINDPNNPVSINALTVAYCSGMANAGPTTVKVGYLDVKTAPVYFYVQRLTSVIGPATGFPPTTVTFEKDVVNLGSAMTSSTGIFRAPVQGIYFFSVSGVKDYLPPWFGLSLLKNGNLVGKALTEGANLLTPFTLKSTLQLAVGDVITLVLNYGSIAEAVGNNNLHYTGYLVEETMTFT